MADQSWDVCVVGSGAAGGMAAWALASRGVGVLLLEAGDWVRASQFIGHQWPYQLPGRGLDREYSRRLMAREPFESRGEAAPFGFGVVRAVGGKSLLWSAHVFRFSPYDFASARKMGADIDWPIRYDDLAPHYDRVERLMGVAASRQNHPNVPDYADPMKPIGLRCCDRELQRGLRKLNRGYSLLPLPKAINTRRRDGRPACHWCGHCNFGCEIESKYTSANTPVPKALQTGRCTLLTRAFVTGLEVQGGRIRSLRYLDAGREERRAQARAFVLACGPIETARLLLATGIANSSGQVGRNLISHINPSVQGYLPQLEGAPIVNDDGTDNFHGIIPDIYWQTPHRDFTGGYHFQTSGGVQQGIHFGRGCQWAGAVAGYGTAFKRQVRRRLTGLVGLHPQGVMLPSRNNFVELDPTEKNDFGLPVPILHFSYGANERAMYRDMMDRSAEIIEAAGGRVTGRSPRLSHDPFHYVGTCRMGDDPRRSVVNRYCQAHDVPNLFIADGSTFTAYPEKNPTLTVLALSLRAASYLAEELRKGNFIAKAL